MNWTDEQKKVIESRRSDLLVSAAAGSGKTAVLSSRIVSLLTDREQPADIDRILVVTFTNAAAAEMRERIGTRIAEALEADPLNHHLKKQSTLLHRAMITTIDSFCLYVLKNYGSRIGIQPGFLVADPGEITLLQSEVMERLLLEAFEQGEPEVLSFLSAYRSTRSTKPAAELIQRTADFSESFPWPEEWLSSCLAGLEAPEDLFARPLARALMEMKKQELCGYISELERCIDICRMADGPEAYAETLLMDLEELNQAVRCSGEWDSFSRALRSCFSNSLKRLTKYEGDPAKKDLVQGIRNEIKKEIKKDDCFFAPKEDVISVEKACAGHIRTLLTLAKRYRELFALRKREKNLVDFADIEHFALRILVTPDTKEPTEVAEILSSRFDEIMIDEYQDSNLVQETILSAIARKEPGRRNRFMVGDVKQSIYRFRQARPELFMEKYSSFGEIGEQRKIDLHKNFRSRKELLDAANDVFYRLMGEDVGGISYDTSQELVSGASYPDLLEGEKAFSIRLMDGEEGEETDLLIDTIRTLVTKEKRRFSDIAVLVRSPGSVGEGMLRALQNAGIPALLPLRTGFFSAREVQVLLNLLRIIDNPQQDIPLASVMKSVIGGFSEEDLARIRLAGEEKDRSFHQCVKKSPLAKDFLSRLSEWRKLAAWLPVHELLQKICRDTGYLEALTALPAGEQRCANVRMLTEKAVTYQKTSYHGLFGFVRYMESLEKYEEDFGEAELLNEETDAVRILSIHKSKGLEFPVVILFGTGREMNRRDTADRLLLSPEYGLGLLAIDEKERTKQSTFTRDTIARLVRRDSVGEELRVLYVALTRAKEKLFVTGVKRKLKEYLELCRISEEGKMRSLLSSRKRLCASSYLELLLPAVLGFDGKYEPEILTAEELLERAKGFCIEAPEGTAAPEEEEEYTKKDFAYPYAGEEEIRDKISVTELKRRMAEEEGFLLEKLSEKEEEPVPGFAAEASAEKSVDYSLRGSAFHRAMECFDFRRLGDLLALETEERVLFLTQYYEKLTEERRLTKEYFDLLNWKQILVFLESDTAKRMEAAEESGRLFKEKPFVLGLPGGRIYGGNSKETVITQGIIDVFFTSGNLATILDYKTDRVRTEEELKSKYKIQLDLYEEAVRRITGCEETEKLLYSFALGKTIRL